MTLKPLLLLLCLLATVAVRAADRPNIVFILADDLGYGDVGPFGQKRIKTPVLDRLAAEGITFTSAYAGAPVCAPSRCVLMTGLHTGHARIRGNSAQAASRDPAGIALQPGDNTLGTVLKSAGYATGAIGKWGLGDMGARAMGLPARHGIDYFFGYLNQGHAHNSYPTYLWRCTPGHEEKVPLPNLVPNEAPNGTGISSNKAVHTQDLFITEAEQFIRRQKDGPFFLYFAVTLPHANSESRPLGLEIPTVGDYEKENWPEAEKRYAAMVTRLDTDVGRIVALLKELGIEKNTVLVFTSDNGPHKESGQDPAFFDSSGGLRGIKRALYEGGIRVPTLVWWPGTAPAYRVDDTPWYFADVLPTFAALAGVPAPATDGVNIAELWRGHTLPALAERKLYWEFYEGGFKQAARQGNWKAVRKLDAPIELFDLSKDWGEQTDVTAAHPDVAARFAQFMDASHVPSPSWDPQGPPKRTGKAEKN